MQTLMTYACREGERELVLLERPDARGRLLLLDAPRRLADSDDVVIVGDELRTLAEARAVAERWAMLRATGRHQPPHPTASECLAAGRPAA
jgi:hypothetical protein